MFPRTNKFYEEPGTNYQNYTYRPPYEIGNKYFDSLKGTNNVRANAKTYGDYKEKPYFFGNNDNLGLSRTISPEKFQNFKGAYNNYPNYPNAYSDEFYLRPIYPKQFLENYLAISKNLTNKAPQDYRYILARNIQNLGGIEDTISSNLTNY